MGNTVAYESQAEGGSRDGPIYWHGSHPNVELSLRRLPRDAPFVLQHEGSSFLEEPVTNKSTERGEATVSVGVGGENTDNGRETHEVDTSNINKLRYAVSEMQGWRSHMEDKHALNPKLSSNRQQKQLLKDHHLFAVFDGHCGDFASHFCGEHLVSTLTAQKDWQEYLRLSSEGSAKRSAARESVTGLQLLKSALNATFLALDAKLMAAQRQRRLSQLSQLEDLVYSLCGNINHAVFQPGTNDHKLIINFSKQLPASMPANVPLERSGSTGVVVLVTPSHIVCANAGDSRAILSKKTELATGAVLPLSFDHKPNNDVEVCRVEKDGGFVRTRRVDGDLAVSRAFGDFEYKNCERDDDGSASGGTSGGSSPSDPRDSRVTVHPDIVVHTREPSKDEFVVLACDGIWDRFTNRDCANLVRSLVHDEGEIDVGLICEEVIDTAFELDSRDNMTCCVVVFPGAKMNQVIDTPDSNSGVMKRRLDRERQWGDDSTPAKRAQQRYEERGKKQRELNMLQQSRMPKNQGQRQQSQPGLQVSPSNSKTESSRSSVAGSIRSHHHMQQGHSKGKKHKASSQLPPNTSNINRARST